MSPPPPPATSTRATNITHIVCYSLFLPIVLTAFAFDVLAVVIRPYLGSADEYPNSLYHLDRSIALAVCDGLTAISLLVYLITRGRLRKASRDNRLVHTGVHLIWLTILMVWNLGAAVAVWIPSKIRHYDASRRMWIYDHDVGIASAGFGFAKAGLLFFLIIGQAWWTAARFGKPGFSRMYAPASADELALHPRRETRDMRARTALIVLMCFMLAVALANFAMACAETAMSLRWGQSAALVALLVPGLLQSIYAIAWLWKNKSSKNSALIRVRSDLGIMAVFLVWHAAGGAGVWMSLENWYEPAGYFTCIISWANAGWLLVIIAYEGIYTAVHHGSPGFARRFAEPQEAEHHELQPSTSRSSAKTQGSDV